MKIIQKAKFALMYGNRDVVHVDHMGRKDVENIKVEDPIANCAIIELNGLQFTSAAPRSAAEAAKINEVLHTIQ